MFSTEITPDPILIREPVSSSNLYSVRQSPIGTDPDPTPVLRCPCLTGVHLSSTSSFSSSFPGVSSDPVSGPPGRVTLIRPSRPTVQVVPPLVLENEVHGESGSGLGDRPRRREPSRQKGSE